MRRLAFLALLGALVLAVIAEPARTNPRLRNSFRRPVDNGWIFVHLQGAPADIGFQNGFLMAPEIADLQKVMALELNHDEHKDWDFYRTAARDMMWPHIEAEYRQELQGIADGADANGDQLDVWDVVAMNAFMEWSYYDEVYDRQHRHGLLPAPAVLASDDGDHCSAFVATGSWTRDGGIVMAHNNWTNYLDGERWRIIYDIEPDQGQRILMDGLPGVIHSGDDFGVNAAGIMITETTISDFHGYDPNAIPEFVRARKAMQYATSIDEFARIMEDGNNGGYANDWLVGDRKTGEIASLELGLKNVTLQRTRDGYFVSSNFPINPKLTKEETTFDVHNPADSANARHVRWLQLMAEYKGKIDVAAAEKFEADHYDTYLKKWAPSERTLCGHHDLSPTGTAYNDSGAVENKAIDSTLASQMSFMAAAGHACGIDFKAADWLAAHPQYKWEAPLLHDMDAFPWTKFSISSTVTP